MSRASSGFESSHLPPSSPEPHPSTSSRFEKADPPSINFQIGPPVSRSISRSRSCSELRGYAVLKPLRRSLSLESVNVKLDSQSGSSAVTSERSAHDSGDVHHHEVGSLFSSQPPATEHRTLPELVKATHPTPIQTESDVSGERSDLPPLTAPVLNPHEDAFQPNTSPGRLTNLVVSANIEARRLKLRRDKKNSVKVCSLAEEKL